MARNRSQVAIQIQNGGIGGLVGTSDGVAGMILSGISASGLALNTAQKINSVNDARNLGIDESFDTSNNVKAFDNIREFYNEAGTGKELWIMLVSESESLTDICDFDGANPRVKELLDSASGKIRILGVQRSPASGYSPTITEGIDSDVYTAATELQTTLTNFEGEFRPCVGILDGLAFNDSITDLKDLQTLTENKIGICLANTDEDAATNEFKSTSIGAVVGKFAGIPVQRSIGRVKDGSLNNKNYHLGSTSYEVLTTSDMDTLSNKGYIYARPYIGKDGAYFDSDPTATVVTDDYNTISRNRVINKAIELAYATYVNELNDEVVTNADGTLPIAAATYYQGLVETQIGIQMENTGEISAFSVFVDPSQNVVVSGELVVEITIVPVGINNKITVKLGFSSSLNS